MTCSLEEAIRLLNKWKAEDPPTLVHTALLPEHGAANIVGRVREASVAGVQVVGDACELFFSPTGAVCEYTEAHNLSKTLLPVGMKYGSALAIRFPNGDLVVLGEMLFISGDA